MQQLLARFGIILRTEVTSMVNKLEIEGSLEKAGGKIKEAVGKVTNSPSTVAEGKAEQLKGEAKVQAGHLKDAVNKARS
jgi:uncharacterized protein YjbJ (UPF0337 family)